MTSYYDGPRLVNPVNQAVVFYDASGDFIFEDFNTTVWSYTNEGVSNVGFFATDR